MQQCKEIVFVQSGCLEAQHLFSSILNANGPIFEQQNLHLWLISAAFGEAWLRSNRAQTDGSAEEFMEKSEMQRREKKSSKVNTCFLATSPDRVGRFRPVFARHNSERCFTTRHTCCTEKFTFLGQNRELKLSQLIENVVSSRIDNFSINIILNFCVQVYRVRVYPQKLQHKCHMCTWQLSYYRNCTSSFEQRALSRKLYVSGCRERSSRMIHKIWWIPVEMKIHVFSFILRNYMAKAFYLPAMMALFSVFVSA